MKLICTRKVNLVIVERVIYVAEKQLDPKILYSRRTTLYYTCPCNSPVRNSQSESVLLHLRFDFQITHNFERRLARVEKRE